MKKTSEESRSASRRERKLAADDILDLRRRAAVIRGERLYPLARTEALDQHFGANPRPVEDWAAEPDPWVDYDDAARGSQSLARNEVQFIGMPLGLLDATEVCADQFLHLDLTIARDIEDLPELLDEEVHAVRLESMIGKRVVRRGNCRFRNATARRTCGSPTLCVRRIAARTKSSTRLMNESRRSFRLAGPITG